MCVLYLNIIISFYFMTEIILFLKLQAYFPRSSSMGSSVPPPYRQPSPSVYGIITFTHLKENFRIIKLQDNRLVSKMSERPVGGSMRIQILMTCERYERFSKVLSKKGLTVNGVLLTLNVFDSKLYFCTMVPRVS